MNLLVLLGPTAVGKSKLAIELAKKLNGEIISADSMQVYKGMDLGTAKLSQVEREGIPHHLIDIRNPDESFSVSDFIELATKAIKNIEGRGKVPIMVGGTGLYLYAFLEGFSLPIVKGDPEIRERLSKEPLVNLYNRLREIDPQAAKKINPNDQRRIIRALEVYELTGQPISKLQKKEPATKDYKIAVLGLNLERKEIYQRIEKRINGMIEKGLIEEVKGLLKRGYSRNLVSMQALGYKEVIDYLDGKYNFEEMVALLKKKTRNFAKRQMTWFRRFKDVKWLPLPHEKSGETYPLAEQVLPYIHFE